VDRIINPLNYINNFSQISSELTDEIIETAECAEINSEIKTEIKESANLIKHNLDKIHLHGNNTARIVKAMEKLLKEKSNTFISADINALVKNNAEAAVAEYAKKYPDRRIPKIVYNFPAEREIPVLPEELGDSLRLFIDNACSAVSAVLQAEIQISNIEIDNEFLITIRDNGHGIPEKEIAKIFDPFFTTKPTSEGSGLGLYLCKEIMELHGGKISVNSVENHFTEFILHFPLKNF
jgi:signal transduction histidine kinase